MEAKIREFESEILALAGRAANAESLASQYKEQLDEQKLKYSENELKLKEELLNSQSAAQVLKSLAKLCITFTAFIFHT